LLSVLSAREDTPQPFLLKKPLDKTWKLDMCGVDRMGTEVGRMRERKK
jgi:hypothetical protein